MRLAEADARARFAAARVARLATVGPPDASVGAGTGGIGTGGIGVGSTVVGSTVVGGTGAGTGGQPHLVPVTFALADPSTVVIAVDHKPKTTTTGLRRLANIATNPRVSLLADEYVDDDWTRLWWARADGLARVVQPAHPDHRRAVGCLVARYWQYADQPPTGPAIVVAVGRWSGWASADI